MAVSVHVLERSQRVEVSVEQAFDFYVDARNLEPMTPPWRHFEVITPADVAMRPGTLLDYKMKLHGVPVRFVDTQVKGPYSLWEHTHRFERDGEAATVIHDHVRYALPLGPLGAIARRLFVRRDLERIFDYRGEAVSKRLGDSTH